VSDFSPSGVARSKPAVRGTILAARRALPPIERRRRDAAIAAAIAPLVDGRAGVAGFAPVAGEPGGDELLSGLATADRLLLPVLLPDLDLDWADFDGTFRPGRFGLREPAGTRLGPGAVLGIALLVVPAVAVSPQGLRLGRGGGSYDRVLARVAGRVPALAVVDDEEVLADLPAEPHDRPVDGYVTPSGVHWVGAAP
jgi:5-formyltetrahydrofolate cyclo-ligase